MQIFGMVQMKVTLPLCALCGLCGDIMLSSVYLHKFNGDNLTAELTENTEEVLPKLERNWTMPIFKFKRNGREKSVGLD